MVPIYVLFSFGNGDLLIDDIEVIFPISWVACSDQLKVIYLYSVVDKHCKIEGGLDLITDLNFSCTILSLSSLYTTCR